LNNIVIVVTFSGCNDPTPTIGRFPVELHRQGIGEQIANPAFFYGLGSFYTQPILEEAQRNKLIISAVSDSQPTNLFIYTFRLR
jgi:hypothetical protein